MAITVAQTIQYDDATLGTAHTKSSISTTGGNRLVLAIGSENEASADASVTSITDSAGNTWAAVITDNGATTSAASIWATGTNASAITSFTINLANAASLQSELFELSGSGTIDQTAQGGTAFSAFPVSGTTSTPTGTADIAIGVLMSAGSVNAVYSSVTFTSGAGTNITRAARSANGTQATTGYLILATATAQQYSASLDGSRVWRGVIALWQPSAATFTPRPNRLANVAVQVASVR